MEVTNVEYNVTHQFNLKLTDCRLGYLLSDSIQWRNKVVTESINDICNMFGLKPKQLTRRYLKKLKSKLLKRGYRLIIEDNINYKTKKYVVKIFLEKKKSIKCP